MGIEITDDQQEEFKEINAADAKVDLRDHFTHVQTALFDLSLGLADDSISHSTGAWLPGLMSERGDLIIDEAKSIGFYGKKAE